MAFGNVSGVCEPFPEIEDDVRDDETLPAEAMETMFCPSDDSDTWYNAGDCCPALAAASASPITLFAAGAVLGYVIAIFLRKW